MSPRDSSAWHDPAPAAPLFQAELAPPQPLSPRARWSVLALVAIPTLVASGVFVAIGAWPVVGFLGVDVVLLAFALREINRRAARRERLALTRSALTIERIEPGHAPRVEVLQPYWLKVRLVQGSGRRHRLLLTSHGRQIEIGRFLGPSQREEIAGQLQQALAAVQAP